MKTVFDCIRIWESWLNYLEKKNGTDLGDMTPAGKIRNAGYNNYTLYARDYKEETGENYQGQPYCAVTVSMSFVTAYGLKIAKKLLGGDLYYNCEEFYQRIKKKYPDRLHSKAKVGDVALFYNGTRHYHTGFVEKLITNGFVDDEANTSSGNNVVVPNGGATTRKSYTYDKVNVVFYRPPYTAYGISLEEEPVEIVKYPINTDTMFGLIVEADTLNIRSLPSTESEVIGQYHDGDHIKPTYKAFDERGVRWYYVPDKNGWVSGNYLKGWIQEENGQWWYLLKEGTWYTGDVYVIDNVSYGFDDAGYMMTEPFTVVPDANGALHLQKRVVS